MTSGSPSGGNALHSLAVCIAVLSLAATIVNGSVGWSPDARLPSNHLYNATVLTPLQSWVEAPEAKARAPRALYDAALALRSTACSDACWLFLFAYLAHCIALRVRPNAARGTTLVAALPVAIVLVLIFRVLAPTPSATADYRAELESIQWLNSYINSFFIPASGRAALQARMAPYPAHVVETYLRTLIAGSLLYWSSSIGWTVYIHYRVDPTYFSKRREIIKEQIVISQLGMFVYAGLPPLSEVLVESGYSHCYFNIDYVGGLGTTVLYQFLYLALVEIGVYWCHRSLHTNKWLFRNIHHMHHTYNQPEELSPWASIAFHPLDGMIQASPYVVMLFVVKCHYVVHLIHVFFTALWATNIHDVLHSNMEPIMGAKYHTVHHTHLRYNHGQFFIFCDWFWGTLRLVEATENKMVHSAAGDKNKLE